MEKSVRRRELREFIGRKIRAHIGVAEPIPERLAELVKQLVQRLDERANDTEESQVAK